MTPPQLCLIFGSILSADFFTFEPYCCWCALYPDRPWGTEITVRKRQTQQTYLQGPSLTLSWRFECWSERRQEQRPFRWLAGWQHAAPLPAACSWPPQRPSPPPTPAGTASGVPADGSALCSSDAPTTHPQALCELWSGQCWSCLCWHIGGDTLCYDVNGCDANCWDVSSDDASCLDVSFTVVMSALLLPVVVVMPVVRSVIVINII